MTKYLGILIVLINFLSMQDALQF